MLLLAPLQTPAMHPAETDYFPHLGIVPASLLRDHVESSLTAAGFHILQTHNLCAELLEHATEGCGTHELTRLAAMERNRDALIQWDETLALGRLIPGARLAMFYGLAHPLRNVPVTRIGEAIGQWLREVVPA